MTPRQYDDLVTPIAAAVLRSFHRDLDAIEVEHGIDSFTIKAKGLQVEIPRRAGEEGVREAAKKLAHAITAQQGGQEDLWI